MKCTALDLADDARLAEESLVSAAHAEIPKRGQRRAPTTIRWLVVRPRCLAPGFALLGSLTLAGTASTLTVDCGRLLDVRTGQWQERVSVEVREGKVATVHGQNIQSHNGERVDLGKYFCLPGLIDAHVHLDSQSKDQAGTYADMLFQNSVDAAFESVGFAEKTLLAGFTTVRDLGAEDNINISMKRAVEPPRRASQGSMTGRMNFTNEPYEEYSF